MPGTSAFVQIPHGQVRADTVLVVSVGVDRFAESSTARTFSEFAPELLGV